jgi:hypothetical protein
MLNAPAVHAQSAAQTAPAAPRFDVASIKPAAPGAHFMFGVRPMPGGGINATNVTLKLLIETACRSSCHGKLKEQEQYWKE